MTDGSRRPPQASDHTARLTAAAVILTLVGGGCARHGPTLSPAGPPPPAVMRPGRPSAEAALARHLDALVDAPLLATTNWAVLVRSLRTGDALFERNPSKLMVPASSLKIVTLAAAAERLGWDFRFTTCLSTTARIENGVVHGDVIVHSDGDPSIRRGDGEWSPAFDLLASQLAGAGVSHVEGRLIGDDNAFEDRAYGMNWAWDDFPYDFSAPVGGLQYNENVVDLRITPGAEGERTRVEVLDPAAGVEVVSEVVTGPAGAPTSLDYERLPGHSHLRVVGQVAADAAPLLRTASVPNPTLYFTHALRAALAGHGIRIDGEAVDVDDLAPPAEAGRETGVGALRVLATYQSPTLLDLGTRLMKVSQNLIAETLFKRLAMAPSSSTAPAVETNTSHPRCAPSDPASVRIASASAGREAIGALLLGEWKLEPGQLVAWDGSGLSRRDYVTPALLVDVLTRMARSPVHQERFASTLPIAGRDGSLEHRMKGTAAEGNVRAKTGSMSQVRSLSGYVTTADGEPLVFSIIANGFTAAPARVDDVMDAAMDALARFRRDPP